MHHKFTKKIYKANVQIHFTIMKLKKEIIQQLRSCPDALSEISKILDRSTTTTLDLLRKNDPSLTRVEIAIAIIDHLELIDLHEIYEEIPDSINLNKLLISSKYPNPKLDRTIENPEYQLENEQINYTLKIQ